MICLHDCTLLSLSDSVSEERSFFELCFVYQALFRGHYERMSLAEKRGEIQWQRAAVNTMEILRKSGITEIEASYAATMIQVQIKNYANYVATNNTFKILYNVSNIFVFSGCLSGVLYKKKLEAETRYIITVDGNKNFVDVYM